MTEHLLNWHEVCQSVATVVSDAREMTVYCRTRFAQHFRTKFYTPENNFGWHPSQYVAIVRAYRSTLISNHSPRPGIKRLVNASIATV
jgi:hypothetical protein